MKITILSNNTVYDMVDNIQQFGQQIPLIPLISYGQPTQQPVYHNSSNTTKNAYINYVHQNSSSATVNVNVTGYKYSLSTQPMTNGLENKDMIQQLNPTRIPK